MRMSIANQSRLELLASLDAIVWILCVNSYLLSPSHLITFLLRLFSHVQFTSSRKLHPSRSLRYLLSVWALVNASSVLVHGLQGSKGTKGNRGWSSRGIVVDFVGQAITPSKAHLLLLDLAIALSQFVLILLVFADPVPPTRSANSNSGSIIEEAENDEVGRDYTVLLGEEWANRVDRQGERFEDVEGEGQSLPHKLNPTTSSAHKEKKNKTAADELIRYHLETLSLSHYPFKPTWL
ncbi:BQ2448_7960 [Microbotryum intermedium]|uniref:BQ2448_7960 protein n=1 Tax=Microbotryum intermedium TaxID=269621 RepID=A0A238FRU4_9BASI|nr:BQ2448_7960 [Microbotryum intermedium]